MPDVDRDNPALKQWVSSRTREWIRSYRPLLIPLVVLLGLWLAYELVECILVRIHGITDFSTSWFWSNVGSRVYDLKIERYKFLFWVPVATWLGVSLTRHILPRGEISVAIPPRVIYTTMLAAGRRAMLSCLGLFLVLPLVSLRLFATLINTGQVIPVKLGIVNLLITLIVLSGTAICLGELLLALLLRQRLEGVYRNAWMFPLVLLVLACLGIGLLPQHLSFYHLGYLSPVVIDPVYPFITDYWLSLLHFTGLFAGTCLGVLVLHSLFYRNSVRLWLAYYIALFAGLLLPVYNWFSGNLGVNRINHSASALLHGAWLGNPLAGWSMPVGERCNSFIFQDFYSTLNTHEPAFIYFGYAQDQNIAYMPVGPWVCINDGWIIVWLAGYYLLSSWVLVRCNNALPRGYTGDYGS